MVVLKHRRSASLRAAHRLARRLPRSAAIVRAVAALLLLAVPTTSAAAQASRLPTPDLTEASLETLLTMEITSASKHEQSVRETAAAVFVITQEDIRRSGATTIAEVLRLAPGVSVARMDGHRWAISVRGFNWQFANKLLVLIDGRSVYNPFFSGVHWDVQDTALEDIERIEIIRGPGGSLWGANAVNGVINIITKPAADSHGGQASLAVGSETRAAASVRYGGQLGSAAYRVFAKVLDVEASINNRGTTGLDAWRMGRGGFRIDGGDTATDAFTLQGDLYQGRLEDENDLPLFRPPYVEFISETHPVVGGNVLGRWDHRFANQSTLSVRGYFDRHARTTSIRRTEIADTFDLDMQHHVGLFGRHDVVYGGGARQVRLESRAAYDESFARLAADYPLVSAFVQDEISLVPERLRVTLGSKFEHAEPTGLSVQPSGRLLWTPSARHSAWASIARAVRRPSHADLYLDVHVAAFPLPTGVVAEVVLNGNPEFRPETVVAYEAGYRAQLGSRLTTDVAVYNNVYEHLASTEDAGATFERSPVPHLKLQRQTGNQNHGTTHGVELFGTLVLLSRWQVRGGYSWFDAEMRPYPGGTDEEADFDVIASPRHQVQAQSRLSLPHAVEVDASIYRVSSIFRGTLSPYTRVDLRLGWRPFKPLELSIVGQNLLDARHFEFTDERAAVTPTAARRAAYVKVGWTF